MMRIVVFAPRGADLRSALPDLHSTDEVSIVRWQSRGGADTGAIEVAQHAVPQRFVGAFSRTLAGRMLVRALPLDTGVRFWRAVRHSPAVARRVREADLLVAADRDAGFAVWQWYRRAGKSSSAAVRGFPAARARIEQWRQL